MSWTPALTASEKKSALRSSLPPKLAKAQMQLDKLPPSAVILDRNDHAWQQGKTYNISGFGDPYWYRAYGDDSCVSSFELAQIIDGEFTVIHPAQRANHD
ncbi:hypothetical protein [Nesterenkonia rhizosphaerae]|uniref:Uncharacterized protein n=1 Tax=Nesterenkonia rhizosphaerae TaxID=1348272 RepID=A0ABP9G1K3_9MICC